MTFHPAQCVIAMGGGSYDGGWSFEGELIVWNWSTGDFRNAVRAVPKVKQCAFDVTGAYLDVLVRPWDEEFGAGESPYDAFERLYRLRVPYAPDAETDIELDPRASVDGRQTQARRSNERERELAAWFAVERLTQRGAIWDIAWLDRECLAFVHNDCVLETYILRGRGGATLEGEGYGAAILKTTRPLVQLRTHDVEHGALPRSRLVGVRNGKMEDVVTLDGSYNFVSSSRQLLLGRLDRHQAGTATEDIVIDLHEGSSRRVDLGHYDCFNHYIGIEGAPDLYFLQGTPPGSFERQRLCRVRDNGDLEALWPVLAENGSATDHAMECRGCYLDDELGPGLVICGRHFDPNPSHQTRGFIYRKAINLDREIWRHCTASAASDLVYVAALNLVAAAFLDGSMMLLDAKSGRILTKGRTTVAGVPTLVYSLDASGSTLAAGTFDGRIAVVALEPWVASNLETGDLELALFALQAIGRDHHGESGNRLASH